MGIEGLVQSVSAGIGAAVVAGASARKYWRGREVRQQAAFRAAVQQIVDAKAEELLARQADFERRQGQHLDRQDRAISDLRRALTPPRRGHRD